MVRLNVVVKVGITGKGIIEQIWRRLGIISAVIWRQEKSQTKALMWELLRELKQQRGGPCDIHRVHEREAWNYRANGGERLCFRSFGSHGDVWACLGLHLRVTMPSCEYTGIGRKSRNRAWVRMKSSREKNSRWRRGPRTEPEAPLSLGGPGKRRETSRGDWNEWPAM